MKKKKIKIGWVGSGFVGQVAHLSSFSALNNVEINCLAEIRKNLRNKVKEKYQINKVFANHKELLEYGGFDCVVAIVRRHHTATVAKDILNAGYNLFTEKPMASTYDQAKKLVDISKKKKLLYVIGNMRRHDAGISIAKKYFDKFIQEKTLGNIISFRAYCYAGGDYCNIDGDIKTQEPPPNNVILPLAPKWVKKNNDIHSYGKFLTYFIHDINLINYFFNQKPKIEKVVNSKNGGNVIFVYDNYFGTFDYAYLNQNKWEEGIDILFEKGSIKIKMQPAFLRNAPTEVRIYKENRLSSTLVPKIDFSWAFKNQAEDFIKCLQNNKNSKSSGENSLIDIKIVDEILQQSL